MRCLTQPVIPPDADFQYSAGLLTDFVENAPQSYIRFVLKIHSEILNEAIANKLTYQCKCLDENGYYWRNAQTVGDLPHHQTKAVLNLLGDIISQKLQMPLVSNIKFGLSVYLAFGLTLAQAKKHPLSNVLLLKGIDIPLKFLSNCQ